MSRFEFVGYPSGDCESFAWDVDKDTFVKIKTERYKQAGYTLKDIDEQLELDLINNKAVFHKDMFMLYPNDVLKEKDKMQKFIIEGENYEETSTDDVKKILEKYDDEHKNLMDRLEKM